MRQNAQKLQDQSQMTKNSSGKMLHERYHG